MVVFGISIQRQGPTTAESTGTRGTAQDHSEAKEKINQMNRKTGLMKLLAANFCSGRDLFIYLGWAHGPSKREDAQALKSFHH